ncbi:hypothetical protein PR048_007943 [Dryococelus australis]|uniref:Uncharacterized protein n=1 Tax=Dryococelus australis TaxID=614101 RepID=A0ABQ9HVP1_9NEOP|nr:hypothetical protein PR048_007943 [Dryococelus australis]
MPENGELQRITRGGDERAAMKPVYTRIASIGILYGFVHMLPLKDERAVMKPVYTRIASIGILYGFVHMLPLKDERAVMKPVYTRIASIGILYGFVHMLPLKDERAVMKPVYTRIASIGILYGFVHMLPLKDERAVMKPVYTRIASIGILYGFVHMLPLKDERAVMKPVYTRIASIGILYGFVHMLPLKDERAVMKPVYTRIASIGILYGFVHMLPLKDERAVMKPSPTTCLYHEYGFPLLRKIPMMYRDRPVVRFHSDTGHTVGGNYNNSFQNHLPLQKKARAQQHLGRVLGRGHVVPRAATPRGRTAERGRTSRRASWSGDPPPQDVSWEGGGRAWTQHTRPPTHGGLKPRTYPIASRSSHKGPSTIHVEKCLFPSVAVVGPFSPRPLRLTILTKGARLPGSRPKVRAHFPPSYRLIMPRSSFDDWGIAGCNFQHESFLNLTSGRKGDQTAISRQDTSPSLQRQGGARKPRRAGPPPSFFTVEGDPTSVFPCLLATRPPSFGAPENFFNSGVTLPPYFRHLRSFTNREGGGRSTPRMVRVAEGAMIERLKKIENAPRSRGAVVSERLDCSPPIKANRVQSPVGSLPDFHKWESCRTIPLVGRFSRGSPVLPHSCIPALLHPHIISPSSAFKTAQTSLSFQVKATSGQPRCAFPCSWFSRSARVRQRVYNCVLALCSRSLALSSTHCDDQRAFSLTYVDWHSVGPGLEYGSGHLVFCFLPFPEITPGE